MSSTPGRRAAASGRAGVATKPLAERLRERMDANGPITFAEFMEAALYDPSEGFYERLVVGRNADFVTSPHVSDVFGELLARQVFEFWTLLGRPEQFHVVEVGAGDGTLASQILASLPAVVRERTEYVAVERSAAGRDALRERGLATKERVDDLHGSFVGCALANELLDNLPFRRVRMTELGLTELHVGHDGNMFVLVEVPVTSSELEAAAPPLEPGEEAVVSLEANRFLEAVAAVLERGYIWLADYGFLPGERSRPVHGYRAHRLEIDVLAHPGSRDITAPVDFGALVHHARRLGLSVWGPLTQREYLLALGLRAIQSEALHRQSSALNEGRGLDAARMFAARSATSVLVDPAGLGALKVVCLGARVSRGPRALSSG